MKKRIQILSKINGTLFLFSFLCHFALIAQNGSSNLRNAIEAHPDSLLLHQKFIKEFDTLTIDLKNQYAQWMEMFPKNATIPFALAEAYYKRELPAAKPLLLKTVKLDPKMARAYFYLWIDGDRWGEFEKSRQYIQKASELEPDNPNYAFYYANTFDGIDQQKYKKLSLEVAKRFPESERGAQSLYWLAYNATDTEEKKDYYELLKNSFPPAEFNWSSSGMYGYFNLLMKESPKKAISLAEFMLDQVDDERSIKSWEAFLKVGKNVVKANSFLEQNEPDKAVAALSEIELKRWSNYKNSFLLLKAKAFDKAGDTKNAYEKLKISFAKEPVNKIKLALKDYGAKLDKNWKEIKDDVWYIRDTISEKATDFTLKRYLKPGSASLSDYRGKVVLLTYWFPGCGPCRGEFPHFQNVVDKFKGRDLVYLAINIVPEQNEYVIPFVKSSGYSFIPLEDFPDRDKGNLDNGRAAPVNFLIDREGRIMFSRFRTDKHNEEVLENMISSLLNRKN